MSTQTTIPGTDEAWESGELGADEDHVGRLSPTELAADAALIQDSLGLQPISIRLEKTLIESFKTIATIEGIGYQTLMRQALWRFADCETKRIVRNMASDKEEQERAASASLSSKPAGEEIPKAA